MNNLTLSAAAGQPATMSSREIAELTGKRHDNVMMDCRKLRDFYSETYSPEKSGEHFKHGAYVDSTGRTLPCFNLSKDAALDLVTGYSLPHRHAVNQRWQELESKQRQVHTFQIPTTLSGALRLASEQAEQIEQKALEAHQNDLWAIPID